MSEEIINADGSRNYQAMTERNKGHKSFDIEDYCEQLEEENDKLKAENEKLKLMLSEKYGVFK